MDVPGTSPEHMVVDRPVSAQPVWDAQPRIFALGPTELIQRGAREFLEAQRTAYRSIDWGVPPPDQTQLLLFGRWLQNLALVDDHVRRLEITEGGKWLPPAEHTQRLRQYWERHLLPWQTYLARHTRDWLARLADDADDPDTHRDLHALLHDLKNVHLRRPEGDLVVVVPRDTYVREKAEGASRELRVRSAALVPDTAAVRAAETIAALRLAQRDQGVEHERLRREIEILQRMLADANAVFTAQRQEFGAQLERTRLENQRQSAELARQQERMRKLEREARARASAPGLAA